MSTPVLQIERIDIKREHDSILEDLGSGGFTSQQDALMRLSVLSQNYFPEFLAPAVALLSDARRLSDEIHGRLIEREKERVAVHDLIQRAVDLLQRMTATVPTGRIPLDHVPADERVAAERRAAELVVELDAKIRSDQVDANEIEQILIRFIVQSRYPKSKGKLIVAEDVTKSYRGTSFKLRPISLELNRGEILGIVGVNASGKTTLLRMLIGELKQSHGELFFPDFEVGSARRDWPKIRRRIAYVSQTLPRWPGSVYDNLCYIASIYGHPIREIRDYLDLLLKQYGLDKFKGATWDEIPGGYKTRFEIVRALLSTPDVMILDEPLAYLDIISQQVVLRQLRHLARNRSNPIGIIITSQQLYEIESIADRLLVLDGGTTLFSGEVAKLSRLIDDLVIEFASTGPIDGIKKMLKTIPGYRSLLVTETGYIAVFSGPGSGPDADVCTSLTFNEIIGILGRDCPGTLSYARNISNSCRILFEPRMAEWLSAHD
jgi:ABC-2 type transport system ATP-binding protein